MMICKIWEVGLLNSNSVIFLFCAMFRKIVVERPAIDP